MGLRGPLTAREYPVFKEIASGLEVLKEGAAELLWPTRCVLCDVPGVLLCNECRLEIPYIDLLHACAYCGQQYGKLACIGCNSFIVKHRGLTPEDHEVSRGDHDDVLRNSTPVSRGSPSSRAMHLRAPGNTVKNRALDQVVSVFEFVDPCRKIITTYKDRKEVRLARVLAELLCNYIDPDWIAPGNTALVTIPTRKRAIRERGFDHMKEVGKELAQLSGLPLIEALVPNERGDQRGLSASSRQKNMRDSFLLKDGALAGSNPTGLTLTGEDASLLCDGAHYVQGRPPSLSNEAFPSQGRPLSLCDYAHPAHDGYPSLRDEVRLTRDGSLPSCRRGLPPRVILVDDVLTTGATLMSAALTLKDAGVEQVFGLTVARLP